MTGLMLQVTCLYCHHLLWWAWTKPLKTGVPAWKAIGKLVNSEATWGRPYAKTYVGHLQKFNCLRCNEINSYYEPQISIYFSKSIYLLSHIKPKENFTSVKKFLGFCKWSLHTWPLNMFMTVMSRYNTWWSYSYE